MEERELYREGFESYPAGWVIGQNLLLLVFLGVGAAGMAHVRTFGVPLLSIAYLSVLLFMLYFGLRGLVCTHCSYYGKSCGMGWGRIAACFFKHGQGEPSGFRMAIALATWMSGMFLPPVIMIIGLVQAFSVRSLIVLAVYVALWFGMLAWHKRSCETCQRRFVCSASMGKKE